MIVATDIIEVTTKSISFDTRATGMYFKTLVKTAAKMLLSAKIDEVAPSGFIEGSTLLEIIIK